MEAIVTMPLEQYNELKEKIFFLENELEKEKAKLTHLKIVECKETLGGDLELYFADDAMQFIDKAFKPYSDKYERKKLNGCGCITWNFAKEKRQEPVKEIEDKGIAEELIF